MTFLWKTLSIILLGALFAVIVTSVSPVYRFAPSRPFSGPDVYNPYRNLDTAYCW
ncbi:MAG: hypothetical protein MR809_06490 [Rikenellaceae bacterium]|nr:hypothetical protein [Rikenellaceae bacterium]